MADLPSYTVECVLVMECSDVERCREAERSLHEAGFRSRTTAEGRTTCTRALVQDLSTGEATSIRDTTCSLVEAAVAPRVGEWKAFVQVVGKQSAWASLEGGKPTLRGTTVLPRNEDLA